MMHDLIYIMPPVQCSSVYTCAVNPERKILGGDTIEQFLSSVGDKVHPQAWKKLGFGTSWIAANVL